MQTLEFTYDESEARDDHGRWTSGGGEGAQPPVDKSSSDWALNSPVPAAPGTTPIPEGDVRFYHYTHLPEGEGTVEERAHAAAESLRTGLLLDQAKGETYGEPNMVWASAQKPGPDSIFAEFHVPMDDPRWNVGRPMEINAASTYEGAYHAPNGKVYNTSPDYYEKHGSNVTFAGDITPKDIIAVHEPWHEHARYFANEPGATANVISGQHDDLLNDPEYGPAIRRVKAASETASARLDFEYDESKHPRDWRGRWGAGEMPADGDAVAGSTPAGLKGNETLTQAMLGKSEFFPGPDKRSAAKAEIVKAAGADIAAAARTDPAVRAEMEAFLVKDSNQPTSYEAPDGRIMFRPPSGETNADMLANEWALKNHNWDGEPADWIRSQPDFPGNEQLYGEFRAQQYVDAWANSAADSNTTSLGLQVATASELDAASPSFDKYLRESTGDGHAADRLNEGGQRATMGAFVQGEYDRTQVYLKDAGIDSVTLYRGMSFGKDDPPMPSFMKDGGNIDMNPASSWSTSRLVASNFTGSVSDNSVILTMTVPREDIISTSRTGRGALSENEVLVRNQPNAQAQVELKKALSYDAPPTGPPKLLQSDYLDSLNAAAARAAVYIDGGLNADWIKRARTVAASGVLELVFDPDQPRGWHGRWGNEGESAGNVKALTEKYGDTDASLRAALQTAYPKAVVVVEVQQSFAARSAALGAVDAALSLAHDYPDTAGGIREITVGSRNLPDGTFGKFDGSGSQELLPKISLDAAQIGAATASFDNVGMGAALRTDVGYAVMTHEFGHAIDFQNSGHGLENGTKAWETSDSLGGARSHISSYSMTNPAEYFAEAFTANRLGESARLNAPDIAMLKSVEADKARTAGAGAPVVIYDTFEGSIVWKHRTSRVASALDFNFNPDQPRDSHGRWGSGESTSDNGQTAVDALQDISTKYTWGEADPKSAWLENRTASGEGGWGHTTVSDAEFDAAKAEAIAKLKEAGLDGDAIAKAISGWSYGFDVDMWRDIWSGKTEAINYGSALGEDVKLGQEQTFDLIRDNTVDGDVWRGLGIDIGAFLYKPGSDFPTGAGLASWSRDRPVAEVFAHVQQLFNDPSNRTLLHIEGPVHGIDIAPLGAREYAWQREVIVGEPKLTVTSVDRSGDVPIINLKATTAVAASAALSPAEQELFDETFAQTAIRHGHGLVPPARTASALEFTYNPDEPRDDHGRWTSGGEGDGTKDNPILVSSADEAARLIDAGKFVRMPPDQVSILLDKLAEYANEAKAAGEKAKTYDLCKISVSDSNLFCVDSKGIARNDMPQLSGKPLAGSLADALPKDSHGEVSIVDGFRDQLTADGYKFTDTSVAAANLKPTQNELNGSQVAGMMKSIEAGTLPAGRVFVSSDNYVIDGHHRWAAQVGEDYNDQKLGDVKMDVTRVDAPISVLLDYAKSYARHMGVPQKGVAASAFVQRLEFGDSPGHEFHGNQYVLFHGTTREAADSILKDGLRASKSGGTVTNSKEYAKAYAAGMSTKGGATLSRPAKDRAVLKITIPAAEKSTYLTPAHHSSASWDKTVSHGVRATIPAKYIQELSVDGVSAQRLEFGDVSNEARDAVGKWTAGGGAEPELPNKAALNRWVQGKKLSREQREGLMKFVDDHGRPNDVKLYRGANEHGTDKPFQAADTNIRSWSERRAVAVEHVADPTRILVLNPGEGFGIRINDYANLLGTKTIGPGINDTTLTLAKYDREWILRSDVVAASAFVQRLEFGDTPGHEFRGNQWTKYGAASTRNGPAAMTKEDAVAAGFTEGPYYHATDHADAIQREGFHQEGAPSFLMGVGDVEEYKRFGHSQPVFFGETPEQVVGYGKDVVPVMVTPDAVKGKEGGMTLAGGMFVSDARNVVPLKEEFGFNPDQERDANGRWGSGGDAPSKLPVEGKTYHLTYEHAPGKERTVKARYEGILSRAETGPRAAFTLIDGLEDTGSAHQLLLGADQLRQLDPITASVSLLEFFYSEDLHPRDARGWWTAGGGEATQELLDRARTEEPKVTTDLQDLAAQHGGSLSGLDFRIKSEESLGHKIDDKVAEGMTHEEAAASVKDSLRYTLAFDSASYANDVRDTMASLEAKGYTVVEAKNYWQPGDAYQGLNSTVTTPGGHTMELQFHTPESFAMAAFTNHVPYERYRAVGTPQAERVAIFQEMSKRWDEVPIPNGAGSIGTPIFQAAP